MSHFSASDKGKGIVPSFSFQELLAQQNAAKVAAEKASSSSQKIEYFSHPDVASQIEYLKSQLSPEAKEFFERLLDIKKVQCQSPHKKFKYDRYVLGDADGSVGRIVLIAMQSGHIKLPEKVLTDLVFILEKESAAAVSGEIVEFQQNAEVSAKIKKIVDALECVKSGNKLVFIGDVLHDRFSCNKTAMAVLVDKLFKLNGIKNLNQLKESDKLNVIFINGNHEFINVSEKVNSRDTCVQFGVFACQDGWKSDHQKWLDFGNKYFINSYYDEEVQTLYIHNGLFFSQMEQGYYTAFSRYPILLKNVPKKSGGGVCVKDLVSSINSLRILYLEYMVDKDYLRDFTNFRPKHGALGDLFKVKLENDPNIFEDIYVVHGHDGTFQEAFDKHGILGINSRAQKANAPVAFCATAIRI